MGNPDKIVAVGLGEVLYDHDVVTDEYTFGGAPANFADHFLKCSRLISGPDAAEVHVVSAVGDDERGRAVSAELEARGLCDGLCRVGELPTGVVDKRRDAAGVNAYEILPGAWDAMTWSDALARLAARTDVVCFGSLAQRSAASHATVVRFLDGVIRRERPTLRVFDVCTEWNGSWGVWCSMPLSDFLASLVAFFMLTYQLRKFRAIGAENAAKEG